MGNSENKENLDRCNHNSRKTPRTHQNQGKHGKKGPKRQETAKNPTFTLAKDPKIVFGELKNEQFKLSEEIESLLMSIPEIDESL